MKNQEPLAVSVNEACRIVGIGRTKFYEAIGRNQLRIRKVGKKTLVELAELRRYLESLPTS